MMRRCSRRAASRPPPLRRDVVCEGGDPAAAISAIPRPAPGAAVDPITLTPVDEVTVTVLVDNTYDGLLIGDERVRRPSFTVGSSPGTAVRRRHDHDRAARGARIRRAGHRPPWRAHHVGALRHRDVPGRAGHQRRPAPGRPDRGAGGRAQSRPLRPRRWPGRDRTAVGPIPDADRGASVRVDPPPADPAGCRAHGAADPRSARAGRRGFHPRRAQAALAARRRVRPDHRRGRPRDRLRTRHAARASGVDRRGLAARSRW